jgi:sodium-dependent dicarboxylate transporter 2/3/5
VGLLAGPIVLCAVLFAPTPVDLSPAGWKTAGVGLLMAIWWLTEAMPIPATSLVPLVLLPVLGAGDIDQVAAPYANPIIFLFMGGFLIALAMQRWNLHRRIALAMLARVGSSPRGLVAGFMAATALLSMWVSNTATALMMLPIGLSVVELLDRSDTTHEEPAMKRPLSVALMLGIAYAASIGGLGTLIGTPPNAFLAGFMSEAYGVELGFARWMLLGIPLVLVALPLVFLVLTRVAFRLQPEPIPGAAEVIAEARTRQGPLGRAERLVGGVFAVVAVLWMTRPLLDDWLPGLSDAGIAMAGGVALFLLPVDFRQGRFVLNWEWARRLPWGVLILFGGGLSLASAIDRTGLNEWIGSSAAGVSHWPFAAFLLLVTAFVVLLTELTSNTATAAAFLPILASIAVQSGWDPLTVVAPAAIGASCAFMLPVATPPNAIVYGSGRVTVPQMARAGAYLNVLMILLVTLTGVVLVPLVFGTS